MIAHQDHLLTLLLGDCRAEMATLPDASVDAIVTDPPYELGFMGRAWDKSGIAFDPEVWRECLRLLRPGGHLLAFSGTRTQHRMVCAIEDAGFQIRDQIGWLYGSGFPKSLDIGKAIDAAAGAEREVVGAGPYASRKPNPSGPSQGGAAFGEYSGGERASQITTPATPEAAAWDGWGTALKPAWEPICLARKPFPGTVAANILQHRTAGINIAACRIPAEKETGWAGTASKGFSGVGDGSEAGGRPVQGRFPANVIHDGSPEVLAAFAVHGDNKGAAAPVRGTEPTANGFSGAVAFGGMKARVNAEHTFHADTGTAARFFYTAKASTADRGEGNTHPTVKPMDLMRYLCRLITRPGGVVLDPFAGSGSTCRAALAEGFRAIGIELDPAHMEIIKHRLEISFALSA